MEKNLKVQKARQQETSKHINSLIDKVNIINANVARLEGNSSEIRVSDHAIVRYLERIAGIDMDIIRKKILPDHVERAIKKAGCADVYRVYESHEVRVRDNTVLTVLSLDM